MSIIKSPLREGEEGGAVIHSYFPAIPSADLRTEKNWRRADVVETLWEDLFVASSK